VGLTITTADETIRTMFEPNSPPIIQRIKTLEELKREGIKTFVMIAPILPKAVGIVEEICGKVDHVVVDKMNYHYADEVYRKNNIEYAMTDNFFTATKKELKKAFHKKEIPYIVLY